MHFALRACAVSAVTARCQRLTELAGLADSLFVSLCFVRAQTQVQALLALLLVSVAILLHALARPYLDPRMVRWLSCLSFTPQPRR